MANAIWPGTKDAFGKAEINWLSDTIKISIVRGYTYNSAHNYLSDVTGAGGTLVATATLASKTLSNGYFDAADVTYTAVSAGAAATSVIIYKDTGTASTSRLIVFFDTMTGLPVTPDGGDIVLNFSSSPSRIFGFI